MRSMRISALALLAGLIACPAWAQPTGGTAPPGASSPPKATPPKNEAPKVPAKPAAGTLEEMLATALHNNPDIRVAEAKLREAEANLNKARIQVMQTVVSLKNAVDAQKKAVEMAELSHKRNMELKGNNVISDAEVQQSEALLAKAKADLAKLEADLAIPLGRLPGKYATLDGSSNTILQGLSTNDSVWLDWNTMTPNGLNNPWTYLGQLTPQAQWQLGLNNTLFNPNNLNWNVTPHQGARTIINMPADYTSSVTVKSAPGSMPDKIRTALDRPLKIEKAMEAPAKEIVKFLQENGAKDILFRVLESDNAEERVQLMAAELPLGAWLQAVEDSLPGAKFFVREYGILLAPRSRAPKDAAGAVEFWRHAKAEKTKEAEKVATPPKAK